MTGMLPPPGLPPLTPTCEQWHHGGHARASPAKLAALPPALHLLSTTAPTEPAGPRAAGRSRSPSWGLASAKGGPPFHGLLGSPWLPSSRRCSPVAQSLSSCLL